MGGFDASILHWLNRPGTGWLDLAMLVVSSRLLLIALTVGATVWVAKKTARGLDGAAALMLAVTLAYGSSAIVGKPLSARGRPCSHPGLVQTVDGCPPGNSLPSNHSAAIAAAAVALAWSAPIAGVVAIGLALIVGGSRIYLGAHYPSDVVAGFALGSLCAWVACALVARHQLSRLIPALVRVRER